MDVFNVYFAIENTYLNKKKYKIMIKVKQKKNRELDRNTCDPDPERWVSDLCISEWWIAHNHFTAQIPHPSIP